MDNWCKCNEETVDNGFLIADLLACMENFLFPIYFEWILLNELFFYFLFEQYSYLLLSYTLRNVRYIEESNKDLLAMWRCWDVGSPFLGWNLF
uniref:Uncharacterized protein n=1 Tax=Nelumbo nucifera TaxID=4432 RepID=A0A822ZG26_NELNU|nr:TPA_asm: hypothetical protein HUJ06_000881 [Nelumbo nucifera]